MHSGRGKYFYLLSLRQNGHKPEASKSVSTYLSALQTASESHSEKAHLDFLLSPNKWQREVFVFCISPKFGKCTLPG